MKSLTGGQTPFNKYGLTYNKSIWQYYLGLISVKWQIEKLVICCAEVKERHDFSTTCMNSFFQTHHALSFPTSEIFCSSFPNQAICWEDEEIKSMKKHLSGRGKSWWMPVFQTLYHEHFPYLNLFLWIFKWNRCLRNKTWVFKYCIFGKLLCVNFVAVYNLDVALY